MKFELNKDATIEINRVGNEAIPVIVIDDLSANYDELIQYAGDGSDFRFDPNDYYPGKRLPLPDKYADNICGKYFPLIKRAYGLENEESTQTLLSAFSIVTTRPAKLRPIQTLPHFDTFDPGQFAIVHYLCGSEHGGTSFYRHRKTGYESITEGRTDRYRKLLKQQAIDAALHLNPAYNSGDGELFARTFTVDAKPNRASIYPSNILHSGDIRPQLGLSHDPRKGRLTTTSCVRVL